LALGIGNEFPQLTLSRKVSGFSKCNVAKHVFWSHALRSTMNFGKLGKTNKEGDLHDLEPPLDLSEEGVNPYAF
jgi:hypothetical protein